MGGLLDRLSSLLGWLPVQDDYEENDEVYGGYGEYQSGFMEDEDAGGRLREDYRESARQDSEGSRRESPRVVRLPGSEGGERVMRMAVAEPRGFDEVQDIADQLKREVSVVVNVENLDRAVARRVLDFLSGTVYALDGQMQKVSAGVVMFVPRQMHIQVLRDLGEMATDSESEHADRDYEGLQF